MFYLVKNQNQIQQTQQHHKKIQKRVNTTSEMRAKVIQPVISWLHDATINYGCLNNLCNAQRIIPVAKNMVMGPSRSQAARAQPELIFFGGLGT